ncbi:hypothetical protein [Sphingomonas bacterium]|uniref:hypothetical protein n=1 Tax=Sphingomonas bacterium TaxID=1895847 RepID=UPI001C2D8A39|nr:hypothetical protein [Sphingomonas bacterium]
MSAIGINRTRGILLAATICGPALNVQALAQSAQSSTVSLTNLVNTRADSFQKLETALLSGASEADQTAINDLIQSGNAALISQLEQSHLFSEAQIAGITGPDSASYLDNLIATSNPTQHPELLAVIDANITRINALIDLRESQANANNVALERVRANLLARQQAWHLLFAPTNPNGTENVVPTAPPPTPDNGNAPTLPTPAPNMPASRNSAPIPQIDPPATPDTPPPAPLPPVPVRRGTVPNNTPDPALQVDGPRTVPTAPPQQQQNDPATTVPKTPIPATSGQPLTGQQQIEGALNAPVHFPVAPVVVPPPAPGVPPVNGPSQGLSPSSSDPVFTPQNTSPDLGLPNGQQSTGSADGGPGTGTSNTGTAVADAAAAAAAAAGVSGGNGSGTAGPSGDQLPPIVLPPTLTHPGRVGVTDTNSGVATIVDGIDSGAGSVQAGSGTASAVQGSSAEPSNNSNVTGTSLAPIYQGYTVVPGANGSSVVAVPSTQVQRPSSVITAPSTQVAVTSTQINVPSTQVNVPSTQVNTPSTQVNVPSLQTNVPSTQVQTPSSVMTSPDLQPALCGR